MLTSFAKGVSIACAFVLALLFLGYALDVRDRPIEPVDRATCLSKAFTPYQKAHC